ncbi:MAG TPA: hypothetical protein VM580_11745 [Labilithrix sp.]|nr:hypothetical protein [Labilithrix sp.]
MRAGQSVAASSVSRLFVNFIAAAQTSPPSDNQEILSAVRILAVVANAGGVVHENERLAIDHAIRDFSLSSHVTTDSLLEGHIDLDAELAAIQSTEVKLRVFESACALVFVDGDASPDERALLEKIRFAFTLGDRLDPTDRLQIALDRAFATHASSEYEVHRRDSVIDEEISRFSALGAALASDALPEFCEGIELMNSVRLARKVGSFYGHRGDAQYWKSLVTNIVGSTRSWFAVSLLGRLLQSSRKSTAYASTYAIGKVTEAYFASNESLSADELRAAYTQAKKEGVALAKKARKEIDANCARIEQAKASLDAELASERISEERYMRTLTSFA